LALAKHNSLGAAMHLDPGDTAINPKQPGVAIRGLPLPLWIPFGIKEDNHLSLQGFNRERHAVIGVIRPRIEKGMEHRRRRLVGCRLAGHWAARGPWVWCSLGGQLAAQRVAVAEWARAVSAAALG